MFFKKIPIRLSFAIILMLVVLMTGQTVALAGGDIQPTLITDNSVIVNGDISDWDLSEDLFADMYRAGDSNKTVEAKLYLKFDTPTQTLYVMVLAEPGVKVITEGGDEVYVKINNITMVDSDSESFTWISRSGDWEDGWEASFTLNMTEVASLSVHCNVWDDGEYQTAAVAGRSIQFEAFPYDYGDMISDYGATYTEEGGPRHFAGPMCLGENVDGEYDGQIGTFGPYADDENSLVYDDEDGVEVIGNWGTKGVATIEVNVNGCGDGPCYLNGWIDWDNDQSFDQLGDFVIQDLEVTDGPHSFVFTPGVNLKSNFYARFRICEGENLCDQWDLVPNTASVPAQSSALADPTYLNVEPKGEIEDYYWDFFPTAVQVSTFAASSTDPNLSTTLSTLFALSILAVGILWLLHRKTVAT